MYGTCCNSGRVELPLLEPPPDTIQNLFTRQDPLTNLHRCSIVADLPPAETLSFQKCLNRKKNHAVVPVESLGLPHLGTGRKKKGEKG